VSYGWSVGLAARLLAAEQALDVVLVSPGDLGATAEAEEIVLSDPAAGVYKKLVIADGRLVGAVLFGDTADGLWYLDLIRTGSPVARLRDDLVFGRALATRTAA